MTYWEKLRSDKGLYNGIQGKQKTGSLCLPFSLSQSLSPPLLPLFLYLFLWLFPSLPPSSSLSIKNGTLGYGGDEERGNIKQLGEIVLVREERGED